METPYPEDQVARAEARKDVTEVQRDAALNMAADEAARADVNAAAADYHAARADATTTDAIIAARQADAAAAEMNTQRQVLNHQLAHERAAASNNAFGFYLTLGILVAGMLVTGLYLWWRNQNPDNVTVLAAPPPVTQTAPTPPPVTVTTPAPPIVVTPPAPAPAPKVEVNTPPPGTIVVPPAGKGAPPTPGEAAGANPSGGTDNFGAEGTQGTPSGPSGASGNGGQ